MPEARLKVSKVKFREWLAAAFKGQEMGFEIGGNFREMTRSCFCLKFFLFVLFIRLANLEFGLDGRTARATTITGTDEFWLNKCIAGIRRGYSSYPRSCRLFVPGRLLLRVSFEDGFVAKAFMVLTPTYLKEIKRTICIYG